MKYLMDLNDCLEGDMRKGRWGGGRWRGGRGAMKLDINIDYIISMWITEY